MGWTKHEIRDGAVGTEREVKRMMHKTYEIALFGGECSPPCMPALPNRLAKAK